MAAPRTKGKLTPFLHRIRSDLYLLVYAGLGDIHSVHLRERVRPDREQVRPGKRARLCL